MTDRAQSTLDFLLGTVVFLLAVTLVVAVVPGMLDPFVTGTEPHPVLADRAADSLVTDELADPVDPYATNRTRVDTVFNRSADTLKAELGVPERTGFNATIENATGTIGRVGGAPPGQQSVTDSQRVLGLDGGTATVTVRVW
jgi:hypothetical protein